MLNDRQRQVLQAIIEEYINTAEPVSSGSIVENYNLAYSSATIRNDMAELENKAILKSLILHQVEFHQLKDIDFMLMSY